MAALKKLPRTYSLVQLFKLSGLSGSSNKIQCIRKLNLIIHSGKKIQTELIYSVMIESN